MPDLTHQQIQLFVHEKNFAAIILLVVKQNRYEIHSKTVEFCKNQICFKYVTFSEWASVYFVI